MLKILYGTTRIAGDVTDICYTQLLRNNIITIPSGDGARAEYFSDPIYGTLKSIYIYNNYEVTEYDHTLTIKIDITTNTVTTINYDEELLKLQNLLTIKYGNFTEEYPEQKMAYMYLTGSEKVLEIGGNIGRNSLIIGSIVDNRHFVTLECDPNNAKMLCENRDNNSMTFHVEPSALSLKRLIQKGWNTLQSDVLLDGYSDVSIISFDQLQKKYDVEFDTLILDCEGSFYYILLDFPEILTNIKKILVENDYFDNPSHKEYVDNLLKLNSFYVDYSAPAYVFGTYYKNFYEVWVKGF
jgi:FkbM family methyltransferase